MNFCNLTAIHLPASSVKNLLCNLALRKMESVIAISCCCCLATDCCCNIYFPLLQGKTKLRYEKLVGCNVASSQKLLDNVRSLGQRKKQKLWHRIVTLFILLWAPLSWILDKEILFRLWFCPNDWCLCFRRALYIVTVFGNDIVHLIYLAAEYLPVSAIVLSRYCFMSWAININKC